MSRIFLIVFSYPLNCYEIRREEVIEWKKSRHMYICMYITINAEFIFILVYFYANSWWFLCILFFCCRRIFESSLSYKEHIALLVTIDNIITYLRTCVVSNLHITFSVIRTFYYLRIYCKMKTINHPYYHYGR